MQPADYLKPAIALAEQAGEAIMQVYATDFTVENKSDQSPLTQADLASHQVIVAGLRQLTPHWPVLSEESVALPFAERGAWGEYWLIDPLDGTREFVKRNGEFTVNIALISDHRPVLGVVYVPVTRTLYYAAQGGGACKQAAGESAHPIHARPCPEHGLTLAGSRSHAGESLQNFVACLGRETRLSSVGSSLKICLVAEGQADLYPRFGPTSEWDTAAAQCVAEQAGAHLTDLQRRPLRYNTKESLLNPYFLVFAEERPIWLECLRRYLATVPA
jgi:3'(2'), 5'-bisphosphate nucleotidase